MWTPETIETLRRHWAEGLTGSEIAKTMGITRNAVLGARHRYKLPGRPPSGNRTHPKPPEATRTWDDASLRRLTELSSQGWSDSMIAAVMGRSMGAVVSARKRNGIYKPGVIVHRSRPAPAAPSRSFPKPVVPHAIIPPENAPVTLAEAASNQCRYIAGEPNGPDTSMCGAPVASGKSWCPYHYHIVYARPTPGNARPKPRQPVYAFRAGLVSS